jgi:two-component system response regulator HydG
VSSESSGEKGQAAVVAGQALPTILVVDDEPGIVEPLAKIFEKESLRVLTAQSGTGALEILRREPVSVLLTDLVMPGMSGLDLLKASRSVSPETETILMTAYGTVENAVDAMRNGAYDFVTKPVKRAHVVRAVTKALEKRNLVKTVRCALSLRPNATRPSSVSRCRGAD